MPSFDNDAEYERDMRRAAQLDDAIFSASDRADVLRRTLRVECSYNPNLAGSENFVEQLPLEEDFGAFESWLREMASDLQRKERISATGVEMAGLAEDGTVSLIYSDEEPDEEDAPVDQLQMLPFDDVNRRKSWRSSVIEGLAGMKLNGASDTGTHWAYGLMFNYVSRTLLEICEKQPNIFGVESCPIVSKLGESIVLLGRCQQGEWHQAVSGRSLYEEWLS